MFDGSLVDTGVEGLPFGSFARGAPGNAGGGGTDGNPSANSENTGGGGGAGYGDGGRGGHGWCSGGPSVCDQSGGFGGTGTAILGVDRLMMGGGGGAGTMKNNTGTPSGGVAASGERGGGIAIIRSNIISGSGTISANGLNANTTVQNDGSGGGGGGGTVLISAEDTTAASLTVNARGGNGGSNGNSAPHGPGGGGGGFVAFTSGVTGLSTDLSPGQPGTTEGNPAPFTSSYGATAGSTGSTATVFPPNIPGFSSGRECSVDLEKEFSLETTTENTPLKLTLTLTNPNPDLPMTALSVTDSYPANVQNAPVPNESTTCGGSLTASAGASSVALSGVTLAANASCVVEVDVIGTAGGTHTNIIPAGEATADINGQAVENFIEASDSFLITQPMTAQKTVAIFSDTLGNPAPYALPGSIAEYTIAFQNPTGDDIDAGTIDIIDAIPANTVFSNTPIDAGLTIAFDDGTPVSGLTLPASALSFSEDGGVTYGYTPVGAFDSNVTHIRVQPVGTMLAGTEAAIRFRVLIE